MNKKYLAIIYMLISSFCFAVMSVTVKMADGIPVYEKVFFRNFFSVFLAYYIVKKNKAPLFGQVKSWPYLIGRSIFGVLGVITMFYALERIDVATASTIQKLSQFWVLIFTGIFLKEKIKPRQFIYIAIALLGVIIVSKPSTPSVLIPTMVCFSSSIFAGLAYTFVSKLREYEHPSTIVFIFSLFSTVAMIIPTAMNFYMFNMKEFLLLLVMGISAMGGQIFLTNSYHYAKASEVSIYAYSNIIFSAILAGVVWGVIPDFMSIIGIFVIILASFMNFYDVKKSEL